MNFMESIILFTKANSKISLPKISSLATIQQAENLQIRIQYFSIIETKILNLKKNLIIKMKIYKYKNA
jgi:hypothetical protein